MDQKEIYRRFIDWLNQTWWGLPPAAELLPLIQRREKIEDPPTDPRDYMQRFFSEKQAGRG